MIAFRNRIHVASIDQSRTVLSPVWAVNRTTFESSFRAHRREDAPALTNWHR